MKNKKKKIAYKILRDFYKDNNTISVTLTGSYSENYNLKKSGDIDVIIICKKLNKKFFKQCIEKTKSFQHKIFKNHYKIIVNSTFGPIKFYKEKSIIFHLMIYDLKSHIEHTIKSPFTCYDWERSKLYLGKSLKELSPVNHLQLRDFYEARRNNKEYLNDILKGRISFRQYQFDKKKISLRKKYFILDNINKRDFIFHTINFLLINFIKFEKNKNFKVPDNEIDKKFYKIVKNKKDLKIFKKLRKFKKEKNNLNIEKPMQFALNFLKNYNDFIKSNINRSNQLFFIRHKKTSYKKNLFLGQKLDPHILNDKINNNLRNINFDHCYSSPSNRCLETANLIFNKKIQISNLIREINYGLAEGLTYNEIKKKFPFLIKDWDQNKDPRFPEGESTSDIFNRLKKFLIMIKKNKNKKILIVTHNVFLRCLIGYKFNLPYYQWYKIEINYSDLLEFNIFKNTIRSNIKRDKIYKILNKIYINYA